MVPPPYQHQKAPARRRHPLSDTTSWVTNQSSFTSPPESEPCESSPSNIPHHGSLAPGGILQVRHDPNSPASKAEDKRISAISGESNRNSNRDSTSTNASGKSRRKTHVGPWQLGKTIGKGASGRVRKARHTLTGQDAAIKIVSKKSAEMLRSTSLAVLDTMAHSGSKRMIPFGIEREVVIMKLIEHPNIIRLYDVWENRGELYLVLEYVEGGELFDHIASNGRLPESEAIRIFRQLIAGLSYCHRFNICHRDLKPENILMDRDRNIKIVDFGMAALQPAHKWLQTSCGSPHYASPEVIKAEQYRGDRADIWSCGVILYAMLTGTLPFDSTGDWRDVINAVLSGEYIFPKGLSHHAEDLITRILQRDPRRRITINEMWQHPLIRRYQKLDSTDENGKPYIGPLPSLTFNDCGKPIKHRSAIDGEILRNLQNLWHGVTEEELAQRLLDDTPNHEKILYTKLLRFREEQLENYEGPPMDYSTSDYHHNPPLPRAARRSSTRVSMQPLSRGTKRQSQYSLLDPNMPPPKKSMSQNVQRHSSLAETEKTDQSYDPYRPSRVRLTKDQADHARITVLRGVSKQSSRRPSSRIGSRASMRSSIIARAQDLEDVYSIASASSPAAMHSAGASQLQKMANSRRMSRGSSRVTMASRRSATNPSSSFVARTAPSYKRNVSFMHNRKRSKSDNYPHLRSRENHTLPYTLKERFTRDEAQAQAQAQAHVQPEVQRRPERVSRSPPVTLRETPEPVSRSPVRSRKTPSRGAKDPTGKKPKVASYYFKDDARKVSTEIEKLCDDAFNQPTIPLSIHSPPSEHRNSHRTSLTSPSSATSFSVHEDPVTIPVTRHEGAKKISVNYQDRPLPKTPATERMIGSEHLGSYTHRELAKTRDLLKKRAAESDMAPGYLDDVIAHLERLMQPSAIRISEEERRAVSTPEANRGIPRKDTFDQIIEKGDFGFRSASEPAKGYAATHKGATIRVVDGSDGLKPISPVKPLTIRKKSQSSTPSAGSPRATTPVQYLTTTEELYRQEVERRRSAGLDPIEEDEDKENFDPADRNRKGHIGEPKKRKWFRRHQPNQKSQDADIVPPSPTKGKGSSEGYEHRDSNSQKRRSDAPSEESQKSENKNSGKGRFFKIFSSKNNSKDSQRASGGDYNLNDDDSVLTEGSSRKYNSQQVYMSGGIQNSSHDGFLNHHGGKGSRDENSMPPPSVPRTILPQHQNWLARFLRIKPAVSVLCFQVSKIRARKEVGKVFSEWKKYGMRDIVVDRAEQRIWARVDVKNSLHIPPLSLAAEFHTLLHRGRRANLAIARFTQEKGAKSSFERVLEALEQILRSRGLVVEDKRVVRSMRKGAGM